VSNVENMWNMFSDATAFNKDIGNWDVSNVSRMSSMFRGAIAFDQNLGAWDLSSVATSGPGSGLGGMFQGITISTSNYDAILIGWATDSSGTPGDDIDDIPLGIHFHGGYSTYCNGVNARADLVAAPNSWNITADGGQSCSPTNYFVTTWKTDNIGTSSNTEIIIPTFPGETYNYDVDWTNDGTFDDLNVSGNITHNYGVAGTYTVAIRGTFPRIYFNGSGDREKFMTVEQWGTNPWTSMEAAFQSCSYFNISNPTIDVPDLSNVQSMREMFAGCSSFNANINNWNTGNVSDMNSCFEDAGSFNQPLDNWDVSNVTDMYEMFYDAVIFNQDLNSWNTSNVTDMTWMFDNAELFNGDISSWDVSNVTEMYGMLSDALVFNQDLGNWDVSKVTDMNDMFGQAADFNSDISQWDVSQVTDMAYMFEDASAFDQNLGNWDISSVTNMSQMFRYTSLSTANYDALLIGWSTDDSGTPGDGIDDVPTGITFHGGSSTYCNGAYARANLLAAPNNWIITDDGQSCSPTNYFVTTWKTNNTGPSSDTSITIPTHPGSTYNYDVDFTYDGITFNADTIGVTGDITHDYPVADTFTVAIRGTFPRIYFNYGGDRKKILTVEQWGTNPWTSMDRAFYGCENLNITNPSIDNPDLSNVTDMSGMFRNNYVFNGDISSWNVSKVTYMSSMFRGAIVFNQDISAWNVSNVTNMYSMFENCYVFNGDITGWNVGNVTNMYYMFDDCWVFDQDLDDWDVSNVTEMAGMFSYAKAFDQDLNSWDVSNVTIMYEMFYGADAFDGNISNWNVGNVEDMNTMFSSAFSFNQDISGWNVGKVTDMQDMFDECSVFDQNLGSWDVSQVSNMKRMFDDCYVFDQNLGSWDISSVTNMQWMFRDATLSTANYDALLIGWSIDDSGTPGDGIDDIPTGITFHGGNSQYCGGEAAHDSLTGTHGWAITDAGLLCTGYGTVWTGAVSNDWFVAGNWNNGVPTASLKAIIIDVSPDPSPLVNNPGAIANGVEINPGSSLVISGASTLVSHGEFIIRSGADIEVQSTGNLALKDDLTNEHASLDDLGAGIVQMEGTSVQDINGQNAFGDLEVDNSSGVVLLGKDLVIHL